MRQHIDVFKELSKAKPKPKPKLAGEEIYRYPLGPEDRSHSLNDLLVVGSISR